MFHKKHSNKKNGGGGGGGKETQKNHHQGNRQGGKGMGNQHSKNGPPQKNHQSVGASKNMLATMLKLVFEKASASIYSPENSMLNISNLRGCPDLAAVQKNILFDTPAFCDALCLVLKQCFVSLAIINVDNNGMTTLHPFLQALVKNDLHVSLRALSAADNKVRDFGFLHLLSKCANLAEVRLNNNPCTANKDYRKLILKKLPNLQGLDGEGIQRQPLALPWPSAYVPDETASGVLQYLEQFLKVLDEHGPDRALTAYAQNSVLTVSVQNEIPCHAKHRDANRALAELRTRHKDKNHNLMQASGHSAVNRVARGCAEVCGALAQIMYPRNFKIWHELSPIADVQALGTGHGVKVNQYLATVHGRMYWRHVNLQDNENVVQLTFDRTIVLVPGETSGAFLITNDCISLRPPAETAILMCNSPERIQRQAAKYDIDANVLAAIVRESNTDLDMVTKTQLIVSIGSALFAECVSAANNDPSAALSVGLVVARTRLKPTSAFALLGQKQGDIEAAVQGSSSLGAEHFVPQ